MKDEKGVVQNYTFKKNSVGPSSTLLKQSLLLNTYFVSQLDQSVITGKEKDYYVNSGFKLVSERLTFGGDILELIAVKETCNTDIIEGPGLWKYIQQKEFVSNGRGDDYNKTAVKVCVYSAYFGGGNKAMLKGILESNRKDLGLTEKQFRESSYFLECETLAIRVVVRYYIIQQ